MRSRTSRNSSCSSRPAPVCSAAWSAACSNCTATNVPRAWRSRLAADRRPTSDGCSKRPRRNPSAPRLARRAGADSASTMFRKAIHKMAPYLPGEQPRPGQRLIKLNTNENPYPPSPRVARAIAKAIMGSALRLYPAPRADEFVESAARVYSIPRSMILAGNGSDELLAMLFRATLGSGDTVAYAVPTYSLYDTLALVQEARILHFPIGIDFELPLDALAAARANLTIVCSPHSPSGTLVSRRQLGTLAKRLGGRLLAIDEAYVDFADENALALVRRHRNVVVLRTLSKSYSLAGMRLGLCFARPAVVDALMKVKDSYNLSRVALAAGAEALHDSPWCVRE